MASSMGKNYRLYHPSPAADESIHSAATFVGLKRRNEEKIVQLRQENGSARPIFQPFH